MGYLSEMFADIGTLPLQAGASILELGSQDVWLPTAADLAATNAFIQARGGLPIAADAFPLKIAAREVWRSAGFSYSCIDVDDRPDTWRLDLQTLTFPPELRERFDIVTNVGTTEHLANPIGGFAFMHYACKAGGLMFHDVPIFGWANHGLVNPTPKFWHQLQIVNDYRLVASRLRQFDETTADRGNFFLDAMAYLEGYADIRQISWMIRFVAEKRGVGAFIPPFDAALPDSDGAAEAAIIMGALRPFVAVGTWTHAEAVGAVNAMLERMGRSYRALP